MAKTEAQKKTEAKYLSKFQILHIRVPNGQRDIIAKYCADHDESINHFVLRLIEKEMKDNP